MSAAFGFLVWILLIRFLTLMVSGISGTKLKKHWIPVPETSTLKWLFRLHDSKLLHETTGVSSFPSMKNSNAWHFFCLSCKKMWLTRLNQISHRVIGGLRLGEVPRSAEPNHWRKQPRPISHGCTRKSIDPPKPWNLLVSCIWVEIQK